MFGKITENPTPNKIWVHSLQLRVWIAQGKCNRGDNCYYKHEENGAAATKDTKRTNSPVPK